MGPELLFQAEVAALNVLLLWKIPLLKGRLSVAGSRAIFMQALIDTLA